MSEGFKTVIYNVVAGIIAMLNAQYQWIEIDTETSAAAALVVSNAINIILRFFTKGPIFKKVS